MDNETGDKPPWWKLVVWTAYAPLTLLLLLFFAIEMVVEWLQIGWWNVRRLAGWTGPDDGARDVGICYRRPRSPVTPRSSLQSGRTTPPTCPHLVHVTFGPNESISTSSCESSAFTVLA